VPEPDTKNVKTLQRKILFFVKFNLSGIQEQFTGTADNPLLREITLKHALKTCVLEIACFSFDPFKNLKLLNYRLDLGLISWLKEINFPWPQCHPSSEPGQSAWPKILKIKLAEGKKRRIKSWLSSLVCIDKAPRQPFSLADCYKTRRAPKAALKAAGEHKETETKRKRCSGNTVCLSLC